MANKICIHANKEKPTEALWFALNRFQYINQRCIWLRKTWSLCKC